MIDICLVLARRSVAFYWKNIEGPYIDHWLNDLYCIGKNNLQYKGQTKRLPLNMGCFYTFSGK